jgi:hypothetical protein
MKRDRPILGAGARRRITEAAVLWMSLTLASIVLVCTLILWHLCRRGRRLRDSVPPPRYSSLDVFPRTRSRES